MRRAHSFPQAARNWRVPLGSWAGQACFVVGGGPSLEGFDWTLLEGRCVVAVNAAYRAVPHAEYCVFADKRFYQWNRDEPAFREFAERNTLVTTWRGMLLGGPPVCRIDKGGDPLSGNPRWLAGTNSGTKALNLAYLLGASDIHLLGFDMKPNGNWHDFHVLKGRQGGYVDKFVPDMTRMGEALLKRGATVVNWCEDSGCTVFPRRALDGLRAVV